MNHIIPTNRRVGINSTDSKTVFHMISEKTCALTTKALTTTVSLELVYFFSRFVFSFIMREDSMLSETLCTAIL